MKKKLVLLLFALVTSKSIFAMNTELLEAANRGNKDRVAELLHSGSNPNYVGVHNQTPLYLALFHNEHPDIAEMLIEHDADVNTPSCHGLTPLMTAVSKGFDWAFTKKLLYLGADPDAVSTNGQKAISFARHRTLGFKKLLQGEINFRQAFIKKLFDGCLQHPSKENPDIELPIEMQRTILTKAFPRYAAKMGLSTEIR